VRPTRDAVLWGLVSGLSFLVLLTGYELATGWRASLQVTLGVTLLVGVGTALLTDRIEGRLRENERA